MKVKLQVLLLGSLLVVSTFMMFQSIPMAHASNTYFMNVTESFENQTRNSYFLNVSGTGYRNTDTAPKPHTGNWMWRSPKTSYTLFDLTNGATALNASLDFWYVYGNTITFDLLAPDGTVLNSTSPTGGSGTWKETTIMTAQTVRYLNVSCSSGGYVAVWLDDVNVKVFLSADTPPSLNDNLANELTNLFNSINWTSLSVVSRFTAYSFDQTTLSDLEAWCSNLTVNGDYGDVLLAYTYGRQYGIENQTAIQWALSNATMLANGLPSSPDDPTYFMLHDRYLLQGFYFSDKYGYETAKWSLQKAYDSFKWAINHTTTYFQNGTWIPTPAAYQVNGNNETSGGVVGGPRYYDEAAETLDAFLAFYELGISDALNEALKVWNWLQEFWTETSLGAHFRYGYETNSSGYPYRWPGWETAAPDFHEIILKLRYWYPSAPNIDRLTTDQGNRFLASLWASPQWQNFTVVHYRTDGEGTGSENLQTRLENTVVAWASLFGNWGNLASGFRANVTQLLDGYGTYAPAWQQIREYSGLYNGTYSMWKGTSSDSNVTMDNTIKAMNLLRLLGIEPVTAVVGVPLSEFAYQDMSSAFDSGLLNLNLTTRTLTLGIMTPGTVNFLYGGAAVSQNFASRGVYAITFGENWNTITSSVRSGSLPSNRKYFANIVPTIGSLTSSVSSIPFDTPFSLSLTVNDADGIADLLNATLGVNEMILSWTSPSTFSKLYDPENYIELSSGSVSQVNSSAYTLTWNLWIRNGYSTLAVDLNGTVFDTAESSSSSSQSNVLTLTEPGPPQTAPSQNPPLAVTPETPAPSETPSIPEPSGLPSLAFPAGLLIVSVVVVFAFASHGPSKIRRGRATWNSQRQRNKKRKVRFSGKKKVKTKWDRDEPWE